MDLKSYHLDNSYAIVREWEDISSQMVDNIYEGMPSIKSRRFAEMDETAKWMKVEVAIFKDMLQDYKVFTNKDLEKYTLDYLRYKIKNKPLRAYFCRKLYDYIIAYDHKPFGKAIGETLFYRKLAFVFEVVIVIQYLHNQILDEKYDVRRVQEQKVVDNMLSANILREFLFQYLYQEVKPLLRDEEQIYNIHRYLSNLLLYVDLGQRIEKSHNHYLSWVKPEEYPTFINDRKLFPASVRACLAPFINEVKQEVPGKAAFVEGYFQRIYLTNVYFFECICQVISILTDFGGEKHQALKSFSIQFGFMLQIINDYADFAYSPDEKERKNLKVKGKKTTDIFSDIYNFNITLPLIYHLNESQGLGRIIEAYLTANRKRRKKLMRYPMQIMQDITESGGIIKTVELSRKISMAARTHLDEDNPVTEYLENMCDMAMVNKFYKVFFK